MADLRFAWRGYVWDARLQLYHVRHRAFDPKLMVWLQPDPLGDIDGPNPYAYVGWDPFNKIDPLGLAGIGDLLRESWEGIKSVFTFDPGGIRTRLEDASERGRQTQQRANATWRDGASEISINFEDSVNQRRREDFAAGAGAAATLLDQTIRMALPTGDAIDAAASGVGQFIDDPSLQKAGILVLFLVDNKVAKSASKLEHIVTVRFVNKETTDVVREVLYHGVEHEGLVVLKREDLHIDLDRLDPKGRTNRQRMQDGLAPIDNDGRKIVLHHHEQNPNGPVIEVPQDIHRQFDHPNCPSQIDRPGFDDIREDWWKTRIRDFEKQ